MKKLVKKTKPSKDEEAPKVRTAAELFDDTDAATGADLISLGEHEVQLTSITTTKGQGKDKTEKRIIKYTCIEEGADDEGKSISQYYNCVDAGGNKGQGMGFWKRDLALLGYDDISGKEVDKAVKEIDDTQPMVIISVIDRGQYRNARLQGLASDANILEKGEDAEAEAEIEVGDKVSWTDDEGDDKEGTVKKIKGELAIVEDDDDETHKVDLDNLSKVTDEGEDETESDDADDAEAEIEVGDKVSWTDDEGDDKEGKVIKMLPNDLAKIGDREGKIYKVDVDELELAGEPEGEEKIEEGDDVEWTDDEGDDHTGTVKKIIGNTAKVQDDDTDKIVKIDLSDLTKS